MLPGSPSYRASCIGLTLGPSMSRLPLTAGPLRGLQWGRKLLSWTLVLEYSLFALSVVALYYISQYSFLLFHCLAELFAVLIGYCVVLVVVHTRHIVKNSLLVAVGSVYGFVATLDLFHTLTYKGMGVFPFEDQNPSIQLWVAARFLESVMVLVATVVHQRLCEDLRWLVGFVAVQAVLMVGAFLMIFQWKVFPDCFDDNLNVLTTFKKTSEYVVCLVWLATIVYMLLIRPHCGAVAWILQRGRDLAELCFCGSCRGSLGAGRFSGDGDKALTGNLPDYVRYNMVLSFLFCILTEFILTLYHGTVAWQCIFGHVCKVMSFYLIYKALVRATLSEPYTCLFNDLTRINEDLSRATQVAETALKQRSEVMAWMSHEIRTPLNGIIGMIELLHSAALTEEQMRVVKVMDGASTNLLVVINDILDFFKLDAGKMTLELIPTDVAELARSVVALYEPKMAEREVRAVV
eukprot:RCo043423